MTAFGSVFMPEMISTTFDGSSWSKAEIVPGDRLVLHPGAHVLQYSSTCFEGLKAFRHEDGSVKIFRMDRNVARLAQSSALLGMPTVDQAAVSDMILSIVGRFAAEVPAPPGSMYIRPSHIGTEAAIGKAAAPTATSMLYVMLSPVGDYFAGGDKTLRLLLDEESMRCAPHMGTVKCGGNYASALQSIQRARSTVQADQVLFCPNGDVQETGAANFLLIDGNELITKALDSTFLHGVTRHSILTLAADMGLDVQERELSIAELLERAAKPGCEAALSGTAAVLAPVGALLHNGNEYAVGSGKPGTTTIKLRETLNDIQWGRREDSHKWLTAVQS